MVLHMVPQSRRNGIMSEEPLLTLSVPAAGKKYFGLSRNGAYDAAARGDLPTIRIGRLLRVPVRALEAMLNDAGQRRETKRACAMPRTNVVDTTTPSGSGAQRCAQAGEREHFSDSTARTATATATDCNSVMRLRVAPSRDEDCQPLRGGSLGGGHGGLSVAGISHGAT